MVFIVSLMHTGQPPLPLTPIPLARLGLCPVPLKFPIKRDEGGQGLSLPFAPPF